MRTLLIAAAAAILMALSGPSLAFNGGGVNGSLSVTHPGARDAKGRHVPRPGHWRRHRYWRGAHNWRGLPRYAQPMPDYYWPGPQDWQGFGPGPL